MIVLILAFGIGACTVIYCILYAVVLRPLPYREPARIHKLTWQGHYFSPTDVSLWRNNTAVFESISTANVIPMIMNGIDEPEQIYCLSVSQECLAMLGTPLLSGRFFTQSDYSVDSPPAVILSDALWQRSTHHAFPHFGTFSHLNGTDYAIIGIMPPTFTFTSPSIGCWLPARGSSQGSWALYAKTRPSVTRQQVDLESARIESILRHSDPVPFNRFRIVVTPIQETLPASSRSSVFLLMGSGVCVLLIAYFNVTAMLLMRFRTRRREFAIRLAHGANRILIVRQLLVENATLVLLGTVSGLLLSIWTTHILLQQISDSTPLPRMEQIGINVSALLFSFLLMVVATLLTGLLPSIWASRLDLNEQIKGSFLFSHRAPLFGGPMNLLLTAVTSLSFVLLVTAALLSQSLFHLINQSPGFDMQHTISANLPVPTYRLNWQGRTSYIMQILYRIQSLPGVTAAGVSTTLPLNRSEGLLTQSPDSPQNEVPRLVGIITPGYLNAMGIAIRSGRDFTYQDTIGAPSVIIVNQTLARQYWPDQSPLGKKFGKANSAVVGVVNDVKYTDLGAPHVPAYYAPYFQIQGAPFPFLAVRCTADASNVVTSVRNAIREVAPDQPIKNLSTMEQIVSASIAGRRQFAASEVLFAAFALLMAVTTIYSTVRLSVKQKWHEIGVRMALGATPRAILRQYLTRITTPILLGLLLGFAGARTAATSMSSWLFEIKPTDVTTNIIVSIVFLVPAMMAIIIAIHQSIRTRPSISIRSE